MFSGVLFDEFRLTAYSCRIAVPIAVRWLKCVLQVVVYMVVGLLGCCGPVAEFCRFRASFWFSFQGSAITSLCVNYAAAAIQRASENAPYLQKSEVMQTNLRNWIELSQSQKGGDENSILLENLKQVQAVLFNFLTAPQAVMTAVGDKVGSRDSCNRDSCDDTGASASVLTCRQGW